MDLCLMNNSNMSDKVKALILSVGAFCAIFKVIKSGCYNFSAFVYFAFCATFKGITDIKCG